MGDLSSGGVLKIGRERSSQLLRPRPLTVSMSRSQLFLGRLHSCIACLRFASRLHFGTSGCNCKHVPHRKGDWQGLRFALRRSASALPVATTQERRKRSYNKYREFWLSLTGRSLDARQFIALWLGNAVERLVQDHREGNFPQLVQANGGRVTTGRG